MKLLNLQCLAEIIKVKILEKKNMIEANQKRQNNT